MKKQKLSIYLLCFLLKNTFSLKNTYVIDRNSDTLISLGVFNFSEFGGLFEISSLTLQKDPSQSIIIGYFPSAFLKKDFLEFPDTENSYESDDPYNFVKENLDKFSHLVYSSEFPASEKKNTVKVEVPDISKLSQLDILAKDNSDRTYYLIVVLTKSESPLYLSFSTEEYYLDAASNKHFVSHSKKHLPLIDFLSFLLLALVAFAFFGPVFRRVSRDDFWTPSAVPRSQHEEKSLKQKVPESLKLGLPNRRRMDLHLLFARVPKIAFLLGVLVLLECGIFLLKIYKHRAADRDGLDSSFFLPVFFFQSAKALLFLAVLFLLGNGWGLIKPFVSPKKRAVLAVVLSVQVVSMLLYLLRTEVSLSETTKTRFQAIVFLIDFLCYLVSLTAFVDTMKELKESSAMDGKQAYNLRKLQQLNKIYSLVTTYWYFQKGFLILLELVLSDKHYGVYLVFKNLVEIGFYALLLKSFMPKFIQVEKRTIVEPVSAVMETGKERSRDKDHEW